jgi:6-phosphofructokinase
MKKLILTILALAPLLPTSYDTGKEEVLTDQDKATIRSEVHVVLKQVVEHSEAEQDSSEFIYVSNGVLTNYNGFIKPNKKIFNVLEKQKYNETPLIFTFIDKKNVVLTYEGSAISTFKDKQQLKIDPFTATLVFRKIENSWKAIHTL